LGEISWTPQVVSRGPERETSEGYAKIDCGYRISSHDAALRVALNGFCNFFNMVFPLSRTKLQKKSALLKKYEKRRSKFPKFVEF
jgi:hypothetical protein